jgi:GAF domain-containing protein
MGTFCVFDKKSRALSAEDRQLLKDLAALAEQELAMPEPTLSH